MVGGDNTGNARMTITQMRYSRSYYQVTCPQGTCSTGIRPGERCETPQEAATRRGGYVDGSGGCTNAGQVTCSE